MDTRGGFQPNNKPEQANTSLPLSPTSGSTNAINNINPAWRGDNNALESVSYSARVVDSALSGRGSLGWLQDNLLQNQRRSSLSMFAADAAFSNATNSSNHRRDSLSSMGLGGDLNFPSSRRGSLAFGMELSGRDLGASQQQHRAASLDLSNNTRTVLSSQMRSSPQSLLNAIRGNETTAQLQLLSERFGGDTLVQEQHALQQLQQQQQQQQEQQQQHLTRQQQLLTQQQLNQLGQQSELSLVVNSSRPSDAQRIQSEAQKAAAALFLGGPLPESEDSSPTNSQSQSLLGNSDLLPGRTVPQESSSLNPNPFGLSGFAASDLRSLSNPHSSSIIQSEQSLLMNPLTNNPVSIDTSFHASSALSARIQQLEQQQLKLEQLQASLGGTSGQNVATRTINRGENCATENGDNFQIMLQLQQQEIQEQMKQQSLRAHSLGFGLPVDFSSAQVHSERILAQSGSAEGQVHPFQVAPTQGTPGGAFQPTLQGMKDNASSGMADVPNAKQPTSKKDAAFPLKLHEILSNPEYSDMIAWLPHGKSWRILKPSAFENVVIPLHFRHSKYASFMRQVNGWGFERVMHGNDHNSYKHELFVRDQPELCKKMKRVGTFRKAKEIAEKDGGNHGGRESHIETEVKSEATLLPKTDRMVTARSALSEKFSSQSGGMKMDTNVTPPHASISLGHLIGEGERSIDTSSLQLRPLQTTALNELGDSSMNQLLMGNSESQQQRSSWLQQRIQSAATRLGELAQSDHAEHLDDSSKLFPDKK